MTDQPFAPELTLFAATNYRGAKRPFGIKLDDRRRHMYVIGKTGMGKSTMLENMIIQDIRAGRGLAVVDPHGDLVEKVLRYVPSYRINDIIYLNPSDVDFPIAFNILEAIDPAQRHLVSSGLIAVFKKLWVDSWGPRLEYILRNTILALIEYPGSTLLGVTRMYVDKNYRQKVVDHISDPIVKAFWQTEFNSYANQFRTEAVSPIQNKIGQFLSSAIIRNIVGQPKSSIDMRDIMDSGKILLLNLAKGRIGEDNAALLGAMMITKLQVAAMSRINVPEKDRRDFFLYVDEFQNFATESFANILSEARKYRLDLIIAHQYIEQLDEAVQAAVFGNVGTIVCFRVGAADAEFLAKEFFPTFTETDLVNLTKYDMYLKLMIDGVASEPFSATGLPPVDNPDNLEDKVIKVSRERYAKERSVVEEKIVRWSGVNDLPPEQSEEGRRNPDRGPKRYDPEPRRDERRPIPPIAAPAATPPPATSPSGERDMVVLERHAVVARDIPQPISLSQALGASSPPRPSPHPPRSDQRYRERHHDGSRRDQGNRQRSVRGPQSQSSPLQPQRTSNPPPAPQFAPIPRPPANRLSEPAEDRPIDLTVPSPRQTSPSPTPQPAQNTPAPTPTPGKSQPLQPGQVVRL